MAIKTTKIDGLLIIEREVRGDERGFFLETHRMNELTEALGRKPEFVQQNHSRSAKNVLRGIHTAKWEKLVYCVRGEIFCAFVDTRADSKTFGAVEEIMIGEKNRVKIFIPIGVGNSMCVISEYADYLYDVTDYYTPDGETATQWNDPVLGINWPVAEPTLSQRDLDAKGFVEQFGEIKK